MREGEKGEKNLREPSISMEKGNLFPSSGEESQFNLRPIDGMAIDFALFFGLKFPSPLPPSPPPLSSTPSPPYSSPSGAWSKL